ncbi:MAG: 16S rRNA (adenine(1518)-N(6)/adenine(1519)-N(6))-dimethyltransferase RsmA [Syntrophobacter sp.]
MDEYLTPGQYFQLTGGRPRKHFGQHFLAQPATALRIVRSAELREAETVVEIGPGLGALTQFLVPLSRRLHLIEIDREMAAYQRERIPSGDSVQVHEQDVLSFDFAALGEKEGGRLVLLGNLPYSISSPLVFHLLAAFPAIDRGVFMVQKEVGERFSAVPGTKQYGVLSVLLGIYARVRPLFTVGPRQFHPPPKVDSMVLRMDFLESAPAGPPFSFMRRFVSAAFQKRRKTLLNSLKGVFGISSDALASAFPRAGIDSMRRPETLSAAEFVGLASAVRDVISPATLL